MNSAEIGKMITERMVAALEDGTVPWRRGWSVQCGGLPRSMATGALYRGVNVFTLGLETMTAKYGSPWWGTFDRIAELSGMVRTPRPGGRGWYWKSPDGARRGVRKGEHATRVVHWKTIVKPDPDHPDDPERQRRFLTGRTDRVFNASQAGHLPDRFFPDRDPASALAPLPEPDAVLKGYLARGGPEVVHAFQGRAFYRADTDTITLPERGQFASPEEYAATCAHEWVHSTGHPARLDREGIRSFDHFGSDRYSREELAAEMGAAMFCEMTGVRGTFDNSAAYIASWLAVLRNDVTLIPRAATEAQAAIDLIFGTGHAAAPTSGK